MQDLRQATRGQDLRKAFTVYKSFLRAWNRARSPFHTGKPNRDLCRVVLDDSGWFDVC